MALNERPEPTGYLPGQLVGTYWQSEKYKAWRKGYEQRPERKERARIAKAEYAARNPEKVRESKIAHRPNRRVEALAAKDVPCADCGQRFPTCCMDFDHREGVEKHERLRYRGGLPPISMTALATQNIEAFREELKKCDVVCANCHRIRTRDRRLKKPATI